jgi:hypothetical protein
VPAGGSGRAPPPRRRSPSPAAAPAAAPPTTPTAAAAKPAAPAPAPAPAAPSRSVEYGVRVPSYSVATFERDYCDLARRHPHLTIPNDFSRLACSWLRRQPGPPDSLGCGLVPLDRQVRIEHEQDLTRCGELAAAAVAAGAAEGGEGGGGGVGHAGGVKYVSKVRATRHLEVAWGGATSGAALECPV